jgi:aminomethyltransferase
MAVRKTPIYESHVERGGRMVEFAGFHLPVSYDGIVAEHDHVRNAAGLFDVSHMGEIEISGNGAVVFADSIVTNNVGKLAAGQICYTVACNDAGKVLDDLLAYRISEERILLVVNAVNTEKIYDHLKRNEQTGIQIKNRTNDIGQIAVQGPRSLEVLLKSGLFRSVADEIEALKYYRFVAYLDEGDEIIVSRTGYTGERGYEIYLPAARSLSAWKRLLEVVETCSGGPVGLGARDTLRFEASYCLYGHELDEETSPLEAGLSWVVKFKKGDYIGKDALEAEKVAGSPRRLMGFEIEGRGIARQGFNVLFEGSDAGVVTSGTFAPSLKRSLAMALVSSSVPANGEDFAIEIRGKAARAKRVELPFYKSRSTD